MMHMLEYELSHLSIRNGVFGKYLNSDQPVKSHNLIRVLAISHHMAQLLEL